MCAWFYGVVCTKSCAINKINTEESKNEDYFGELKNALHYFHLIVATDKTKAYNLQENNIYLDT